MDKPGNKPRTAAMPLVNVYLIDDEPAMLELLTEAVKQTGLNAQGYNLASRFFEQVTVFKPGTLLVLDLHMPEMDGIEVMRQLAKMDNPPPLILISGHDTGVLYAAEKLGRAHNLEILSSLSKPVSLMQFQGLIRQFASGDIGSLPQEPPQARRLVTVDELEDAIRNNLLVLHYQPQIEMASGKLIGVEALVRWQHTELGMIFPDHFISLAEQSGLISELTYWVIAEVVKQERLWQSSGLTVAISANISADNITSLVLPEQLTELLANHRLDPTRLTLEVTESALMGELVTSLDILTRLRLKGIGLSIDDFGTGYSSLSQLHRVPFTELKIDRSFVLNMTEDAEARAIVKTCVLLANELGMLVVAEGVEDQRSWDLLLGLGCDVAQGYFISKPVSGDELQAWVINREQSKGTRQF